MSLGSASQAEKHNILLVIVKHQTELDPFAAFFKNGQTGSVNTSKQGNGDRAETESRVRRGIEAGS